MKNLFILLLISFEVFTVNQNVPKKGIFTPKVKVMNQNPVITEGAKVVVYEFSYRGSKRTQHEVEINLETSNGKNISEYIKDISIVKRAGQHNHLYPQEFDIDTDELNVILSPAINGTGSTHADVYQVVIQATDSFPKSTSIDSYLYVTLSKAFGEEEVFSNTEIKNSVSGITFVKK
jgi:hypothetical protein